MLRTIIVLLSIAVASIANGQSLKKYPIGNSGCSAYFFCTPGDFALNKSEDSSDIYTGECMKDSVAYGVICAKLKTPIAEMKDSEDMLISYLDYLKKNFNITKSAGYGKGHRLKNREDTRGVIDYWEDQDKANWKVKGWTNGKYVVVMYVYSVKELQESKANIFLDGLVLP